MSRKTYCYSTTPAGHKVHIDVENEGRAGPVMIGFHGGGIVMGSRRDDYTYPEILDNWPGTWIHADYRLLVPSSGRDILDDVRALFHFLTSILSPEQLDNIFVSGFSGGGYPMRLAAVVASTEAAKHSATGNGNGPRFRVRGCVSFFGMGGDLMLDYWVKPVSREQVPLKTDPEELRAQQEELRRQMEPFRTYPEISDNSYAEKDDRAEGDEVDLGKGRGAIWDYWHVNGMINDSISGQQGVSLQLRELSYDKRQASLASIVMNSRPGGLSEEEVEMVFPQLYFSKHASTVPPFLLLHGTFDEAVPYPESQHTLKTLNEGGGSARLISIKGGNHDLKVDGEQREETKAAFREVIKWVIELAKNE